MVKRILIWASSGVSVVTILCAVLCYGEFKGEAMARIGVLERNGCIERASREKMQEDIGDIKTTTAGTDANVQMLKDFFIPVINLQKQIAGNE